MIVNNLPALQVVLPLMAAPLCAIMPGRRLAWILSFMACIATFAISIHIAQTVYYSGVLIYKMGGWSAPFGIEYRIDALSSLMLIVVSGVASVTCFYAKISIDGEIDKTKHSYFYAAFMLCFTGLLGILATNDAFNIYVFLEISSLATYALIAMGRDKRALIAAFEYLILGSIGATFILIAVGILYMMTGTLNISDLSIRVPSLIHLVQIKAAFAFFVVGLALKIAMFPLHLWLANAYTNAPSFVSSFLSATATKVSIYILIRIIFGIFGYDLLFADFPIDKILILFAILAIIVGSMVAVFQQNIKRMLAYSSVAQLGYIILGIGLASEAGISASSMHIFNHAIAKSALFMAVGAMALKVGGVRLSDLRGVGKKMPLTTAAFVVASLSIIGVPLTGGFISKWYLLSALADQQMWAIFAVVIFSSILALIYMWRVIEVAYFVKSNTDDVKEEASFGMLAPIWFMSLLVFVFGIYTEPVRNMATTISKYLFSL